MEIYAFSNLLALKQWLADQDDKELRTVVIQQPGCIEVGVDLCVYEERLSDGSTVKNAQFRS